MKIRLRKMGNDFRPEDMAASDCENYRLRMPEILAKDGRRVSGDFSRGPRYDFSGRKPRKVSEWQVFLDLQYADADGFAWRYTPDGKGGSISKYTSVTQSPFYGMDYTKTAIFEILNSISAEPVEAIEISEEEEAIL